MTTPHPESQDGRQRHSIVDWVTVQLWEETGLQTKPQTWGVGQVCDAATLVDRALKEHREENVVLKAAHAALSERVRELEGALQSLVCTVEKFEAIESEDYDEATEHNFKTDFLELIKSCRSARQALTAQRSEP